MPKLNAKQLRVSEPTEEELKKIKRNPISLVLDRIIDTYNIGSLFRLGDAIACEKVYLCGKMEYPPSSRIHKAAVGTENWVPWEKTDSTLKTVRKLRRRGIQVIAVEQSPRSIPYSQFTRHVQFPTAIISGNETYGIEKEVLDVADLIVELPMYGVNRSFNTWGSAAVITYLSLLKLEDT